MATHEGPLGRKVPPDRRHEDLFPLSDDQIEQLVKKKQAMPIGINWHAGSDSPVQGADGRFRVHPRNGPVRGGHCICLEPEGEPDPEPAHVYFNQRREGACEGFGNGRAIFLDHDERPWPDCFWLYDDAQRIEGSYEPDGGSVDLGATNRSTAKALVKWGAHVATDEFGTAPSEAQRVPWVAGLHGLQIAEYRWARKMEQVLKVLGYPLDTTEIPWLNSWGTPYPHRVYVPVDELDKLIFGEEGEASVFIRPLD